MGNGGGNTPVEKMIHNYMKHDGFGKSRVHNIASDGCDCGYSTSSGGNSSY